MRYNNESHSNNLKGVCELYNEEIDKHNQRVLAKAMKDKTRDYDNELIPKLKEDETNRSYWTHVNGKGNLLGFIKKGVFSNWTAMNASINFTNVPENLKHGELYCFFIVYICTFFSLSVVCIQ